MQRITDDIKVYPMQVFDNIYLDVFFKAEHDLNANYAVFMRTRCNNSVVLYSFMNIHLPLMKNTHQKYHVFPIILILIILFPTDGRILIESRRLRILRRKLNIKERQLMLVQMSSRAIVRRRLT